MTDFDNFGQGRITFRHKPLCVLELDPSPGTAHRIPIDCVTIKDLWDEIDRLRTKLDLPKDE